MAHVIESGPKDIYFLIEIGLIELKLLKEAMNHCRVEIDTNNLEQRKAQDYFAKEFYPFVVKTIESIEGIEEDGS